MELKEILKLNADEIFDYIIKNPSEENDIINNLKLKDRTKFFKVSADLKSYKLNDRGSAAVKKTVLESITKDKTIISIRVDCIKANPAQPRKIFNEGKLVELSESIKTHGLLQPIVVTDNNNGTYTIIAGERRLRAHILAGIVEIKAIILDVNELESRKLAIIENLHRDDLSPVEEGLSYIELQKEGSYSLRDLEDIVKKNKNYIAARINLTKFNSDCLDFILKHEIMNVSKLLKILETEPTIHKTLLEKLSKNELSNDEIEKFKVNKIEKLPDEEQKEKKSSKPIEVNHDNFNDEPDFSSDKKEAKIEALSEKLRKEDDEIIAPSILKETKALKITGDKTKVINISINVESMTGLDISALKDFIDSI